MNLSPEASAVLEELAANPEMVSVSFFPMGMHSHLMADGRGGWNLKVHSTVQFPWEEEVVISSEDHLSTHDLLMRMEGLATLGNLHVELQAQALSSDLDAELEAFFNGK